MRNSDFLSFHTLFAVGQVYDVKILYVAKTGNFKLFVDGSLKEDNTISSHQKMLLAPSWVGCSSKFLGSITDFKIAGTVSTTEGQHFRVTDGECRVEAGCVTSPHYPSNYENDQTCAISSSSSWKVVKFDTERNYD